MRRNTLVIEHLALAEQEARRIWRANMVLDLDDLIQQGSMGLMVAAERWDARRGVPFQAYARRIVRGHILDHLREQHWAYRRMRSPAVRRREYSLEDVAVAEHPAVAPEMQDHFALSRLKAALLRLPDREHSMLRLYFFEGLSWSEIAARFDVTPRAVHRLQKQAIERLRGALSDSGRDLGPDLPLAA